jgi:hypothetical protein
MKPKEFQEIAVRFGVEQARWEALKIGDIIYDEQGRGYEFDYHKMKITAINVNERSVMASDVVGSHHDTLRCFLTEAEFNGKNIVV